MSRSPVRVACLAAAAIAVMGVSCVQAADAFRSAKQGEIEAYVAKYTDLTKLSNGWSYKSDAKYGYKFSDGSMCMRAKSGAVSCTKIVTDGKSFYMVSPNGTKTLLSPKAS